MPEFYTFCPKLSDSDHKIPYGLREIPEIGYKHAVNADKPCKLLAHLVICKIMH